MATANDILKIAQAEIGYKESSNNNNKYGKEYGLNNQPWCVIFIWWLFKHANASNLFYGGGKVALCSALYNYHKGKGQNVSTATLKPGDIVFFDFSGKKKDTSHVGIVEKVNGNTITTIEGNTSSGSSGSQSNGDGVYRRGRSLSLISCAYRPKYSGGSTTTVSTPATKTKKIGYSAESFIRDIQACLGLTVNGSYDSKTKAAVPDVSKSKNSSHAIVSTLQTRLFGLGYNPGSSDGVFGANTENAVKAFQKAKKLTADGVVGANTWKALAS